MAEKIVKYLVIDSGAFIKNAPINDIGENMYTIRDVVTEIKDKQTRRNLQVLPYELHFKEPPPEAIKLVTEFSKKTGDYPSLSAVDIRLMALVYQLEKEFVGTEHLRTTPERNVSWIVTKRGIDNLTEVAGFYVPKKSTTAHDHNDDTSKADELATEVQQITVSETESEEKNVKSDNSSDTQDETEHGSEQKIHIEVVDADKTQDQAGTDSKDKTFCRGEGYTVPDDLLEEESDEDEEDEEDEDGWITPSNIKDVLLSMGNKDTEKAHVTVGCLTTDFAMQNVLIQMRLNVVSCDGMLIKRARSYVLRCYACFKITTNMTKEFCFHCGNKTLQKVSVTIDEDGTIRYFLSRRRPISKRGTKYSLPKPQGGKHAINPILVEDQPMPHQEMAKKSKIKYDVFDPDYVANVSPFAPIDTTSRSAMLGIRNHRHNFRSKRNPNENRKVYGRRK